LPVFEIGEAHAAAVFGRAHFLGQAAHAPAAILQAGDEVVQDAVGIFIVAGDEGGNLPIPNKLIRNPAFDVRFLTVNL